MTLTLACLSVLGLFGCQHPTPAAFGRPPALVEVVPAIAKDVPVYLDEIGKCVARELVTVLPQVSGRITKLYFTDGSDVQPGTLLFTIDARPFQAALDQSKAALAQSRAAMALAKLDFQRYEALLRSNTISRQAYDTQKSTLEVDQAQVEANQAAVASAALNLEYCAIRSPIEGRAGQRLVDPGNVVTANTTPLVVVERLDPIYVDFTITETDLSAVQRSLRDHTLVAETRLPDQPKYPRTGDVTFLDNSVQDGTGTVKLRATLANRDRLFWPGRFVRVKLILDVLRQAILVPAVAPQASANGPFVYVVRADDTAQMRPVVLGQRQGDLIVITHGLQPGERVVTLGQLAVTPDGKVRIKQSGVAAGDSAAGAS